MNAQESISFNIVVKSDGLADIRNSFTSLTKVTLDQKVAVQELAVQLDKVASLGKDTENWVDSFVGGLLATIAPLGDLADIAGFFDVKANDIAGSIKKLDVPFGRLGASLTSSAQSFRAFGTSVDASIMKGGPKLTGSMALTGAVIGATTALVIKATAEYQKMREAQNQLAASQKYGHDLLARNRATVLERIRQKAEQGRLVGNLNNLVREKLITQEQANSVEATALANAHRWNDTLKARVEIERSAPKSSTPAHADKYAAKQKEMIRCLNEHKKLLGKKEKATDITQDAIDERIGESTIAAVANYETETDQFITDLSTRAASWDDYVAGIIDGQGDASEAVTAGWADAAMNMADSNQLMFESSQDSLYLIQDTLTSFFETGQLDAAAFFDKLVTMWLNTAAQIAANQIMMGFTTGFGGGGAGSRGGGVGSSISSTLFVGAGGSSAVSGSLYGTAATGTTAATTGYVGTGGAYSSAVAAETVAVVAPYIAAAVVLWGATEGFGTQRRDTSRETLYGVKDAHQNPIGAVRRNIANFKAAYTKGDFATAGFNLEQMDDISDRMIENGGLSEDLRDKWGKLTDQVYAFGESLGGARPWLDDMAEGEETLALQSLTAKEDMANLSAASIEFALDALMAGDASSELALAAVELAAATNPAATAAWEEMSAMAQLANAIYNTSEATRGLAQANDAANLAEQLIAQGMIDNYDDYQKVLNIKKELEANGERLQVINEALTTGFDAEGNAIDPEKYAALNTEKEKLNANNIILIDTITNLTGADVESGAVLGGTASGVEDVGYKAGVAAPKVDSFGSSVDGVRTYSEAAKPKLDALWGSFEQFTDRRITLTLDTQEGGGHDGTNHLGLFRVPYTGFRSILDQGEAVLSSRTGDANTWRNLVSSGAWERIREWVAEGKDPSVVFESFLRDDHQRRRVTLPTDSTQIDSSLVKSFLADYRVQEETQRRGRMMDTSAQRMVEQRREVERGRTPAQNNNTTTVNVTQDITLNVPLTESATPQDQLEYIAEGLKEMSRSGYTVIYDTGIGADIR